MTHLSGRTSACRGVAFVRTIYRLCCNFFPLQQREKSEGGPPCNSMPLGAAWAYYMLSKSSHTG